MYSQSSDVKGPDGKVRGILYKGPIDCLYKTWRSEGILGWYKGSTAHLLRIAPHTVRGTLSHVFEAKIALQVLTLVFNEQLIQYYSKYKAKRDGRISS